MNASSKWQFDKGICIIFFSFRQKKMGLICFLQRFFLSQTAHNSSITDFIRSLLTFNDVFVDISSKSYEQLKVKSFDSFCVYDNSLQMISFQHRKIQVITHLHSSNGRKILHFCFCFIGIKIKINVK